MSENTRKAVVTTTQVQLALNNYTEVRSELSGNGRETLEFDKGGRGMKPFATYNGNDVVAQWDTKEQARDFYASWVAVAGEIVTMQADNKHASESDINKAISDGEKSVKATPKAASKTAA